jgi:hypothetical protein
MGPDKGKAGDIVRSETWQTAERAGADTSVQEFRDDPGRFTRAGEQKQVVIAGRKTRIASGTVHGDPTQSRVGWEFKDPDWLRGKTAWMGSAVVSPRGAATETAAK